MSHPERTTISNCVNGAELVHLPLTHLKYENVWDSEAVHESLYRQEP